MPNLEGLTPKEKSEEQRSSRYRILDLLETTKKTAPELQELVARQNYKYLWTYGANCILGLWLITTPHLFDYKSSALVMSDTISGIAVILIEMLSFAPRFSRLRWGTSAVAFWLLFAPLIYWSPTPAVFLIDTLIATFLIALSILLPGTPGNSGQSLPGPDQPPGWTYNPSSWIRRWIGIALALVGFFTSRYLAAHQLGYVPHAWDPFFGDGTDKVTGSAISRAFPISDAGFGSVAYILEVLSGFMGDRARWRSAPWAVVLFACLVLPLGVTSIVLVITQPIFVGSWCGLCLIAAAALMTSVPLSVHEVIAVGQFLLEVKRQKKSFWRVFWWGASVEGSGNTDPDRMSYSLPQRYIASIQGVTVPWTLAGQLVIGIFLMARPDLFPFPPTAANCYHILGALTVTIAAISTAEVTRTVRYLNIPVGVLLIIAGVVLERELPLQLGSDLISGVVLILTSLPKGAMLEKYGTYDKFIK
jgi:hypothetical protein